MAQSSTEPVTVSFFLRECGAILVGAFGVILLLALVSYAPIDSLPVWPEGKFDNLAGSVGASTAFGLFWTCGIVSYVFPVGLFACCAAILYWREHPINLPFVSLRLGGVVLFVLSATTLAALHIPSYETLPHGSGGVLGGLFVVHTVDFIEVTGLSLVAFVFWLISLQLAIGFSWLVILESTGKGVFRSWQFMRKASRWFGTVFAACYRMIRRWSKQLNRQVPLPKPRPNTITPLMLAPSVSYGAGDSQHGEFEVAAKRSREIEPVVPMQQRYAEPTILNKLPSLEILSTLSDDTAIDEAEQQALLALGERLRSILADYGVTIEVESIISGPVVSRFEIQLAPGLKVSKIISLANDLAREIAVKSVRVVPVIPGKSVVGIEIPNRIRATVTLREVLSYPEFMNSKRPLTLALGKDISGEPVYVDLERMPHLLVAGTTGSGKSVGVNTMLLSLLYRLTPEDVRLILIDPKMLELSVYEGIPHLLTPVVTYMQDAAKALQWCVTEMERRYRIMMELKVRNLSGYNAKIVEAEESGELLRDPLWDSKSGADQQMLSKLPLIVVVIDEFADMIMIVGKKIEQLIARIAQKARAAGIHLVLATQRPSVDVITGLIKANIPCRISYQVSSQVDSRTILDQVGAEHLLGHGDMLYVAPGTSVPERVHGAFVSDDEVLAVIEDWRQRGTPAYVYDIMNEVESFNFTDLGGNGIGEEEDDLYQQAVRFVLESRRASASALQTKFQIGWNKAARFMDQMEGQGFVSAPDHKGRREVMLAED